MRGGNTEVMSKSVLKPRYEGAAVGKLACAAGLVDVSRDTATCRKDGPKNPDGRLRQMPARP